MQIYDFVVAAFSPRGFLSSLLGSLSDVKVLLTMTQSRFVKRHKLFKVVLPSMEKKLKEKGKLKRVVLTPSQDFKFGHCKFPHRG